MSYRIIYRGNGPCHNDLSSTKLLVEFSPYRQLIWAESRPFDIPLPRLLAYITITPCESANSNSVITYLGVHNLVCVSKPLQSVEDRVYQLPLGHLSTQFGYCCNRLAIPPKMSLLQYNRTTIDQYLNKAWANFWSEDHKYYLSFLYWPERSRRIVSNYEVWEKYSQKEIETLPWTFQQASKLTLGGFCDQIIRCEKEKLCLL